MEIKKYLDQAVSQVPAKGDLTAYPVYSDGKLAVARQASRIADCDNDELVKALRYAMMLVGIRVANMPVQMEFDFLKEFIRRNFPGNTTEEIKLAFDMAAGGKLELGESGANPFGDFSCQFIGRILTAYRSWAEKVARVQDRKPEEPKQKTKEELREIDIGYMIYLVKTARKGLRKPLKWILNVPKKT